MTLPLFFPIIQESVNADTNENLPITKSASTRHNNVGGVTFQHYLLPDNAGGTVVVANNVAGDNNRIYNAIAGIVPKMALLYNYHGGVVTPNFGDAVDHINKEFNFAGISLTTTLSVSPSWNIQNIEGSKPLSRSFHGFVFITAAQKFLLFGGFNGTRLGDTWVYNPFNRTWAELTPATPPSARTDIAMAYDSVRDKVMLYGGYDGSNIIGDFWEYQNGDWAEIDAYATPGTLAAPSMAFDSTRNITVLFGGEDNDANILNSTWEYNGTIWTENVTTTDSPSPRLRQAMAFDPTRNRMVLFGGITFVDFDFVMANDTWEYDGYNWAEIKVPGDLPTPRSHMTMAYNTERKTMVLSCGGNLFQAQVNNETWEYDGISWARQNIPGPSARAASAMDYVPVSNRMVLFGGTDATLNNAFGDLWEYSTPPSPVLLQTSGDGYVYYDASPGNPVPVVGDFLGPSSVNGTVAPTIVSPVFGYALEGPVIDGYTLAPLEIVLNGDTVGLIKMRISPFYGFIAAVAPAIIDFTPSAGIVGSQVTINGYAFLDVTEVSFDGYVPTTASYDIVSNTQLHVIVPSYAQTGTITILNPQGNVTSIGNFTVQPSITGVVSPVLSVGSPVTINGHTFIFATDVAFNGISSAFTMINDTQITTTIPIGGTTGPITVTTPSGVATFSGFSVVPPPTISLTGISPTSGPVGSLVSITGSGFQSAGIITVIVDFVNIGLAQFLEATQTIFNDTQISVVVPDPGVPQAAINYTIRITTEGGVVDSSQSFTIIPRPTFLTTNSFTPTSGSAGDLIEIHGQYGFTGLQYVFFDGYQAVITHFINDGYITAIVPVISTLDDPNVAITVTSLGGTRSTTDTGPSTSPSTFSVLLDPAISSFSPSSGATGAIISIFGTNFLTVDTVLFNGTSVTASFVIIDNGRINVTVPVGGSGISNGPITVKSGVLTDTSVDSFTYIPTPVISGLSASSGGYGTPATTVIISGTSLTNSNGSAPTVAFGGVTATVSSYAPTSVTVTVPNNAGSGLTLQTDGGTANSAFTVVKRPSIYYTTPTSGRTNFGGTNITIAGDNFLDGFTTVRFIRVPILHTSTAMTISSISTIQIVVNSAQLDYATDDEGTTFRSIVQVDYTGGSYIENSPNTYFGFRAVS